MSLRALIRRPMPVTAPLVLNPLMARMAEAAGFPAGYLGGGGLEPGGKGHVGRHRSREAAGDRARDRRGRRAMTAVKTTRG
jgi:hypothetical protein